MAEPDLTITICPVDRVEVGQSLVAAAARLKKQAEKIKPGMKRDNVLARAIRLERMGNDLTKGE